VAEQGNEGGDVETAGPPDPRSALHSRRAQGLAIAIAVPALVTASGLVADYRRIAIPVLLYLLGVVAAVAVGRLTAGLIAAAASGAGLAVLLHADDSLADRSDPQTVLSVGLFFVVALVFAYVIAGSQTARRAAEDAERDMRFLIDGAGDTALFKLDGAGRVASWNAGAERLLGYTRDEALGLELAAFLAPDELAAGKVAVLLDTVGRGGPSEEEGWRIRKDGSLLWAASTLTPMLGEAGRPTGYAHVIRDLTAHKRLEDDLSVLALQDSLTRLPNRALFLQHLAGALARVRRQRTVLALLFLDLDDFKAVNDSHGHAAGDELLVSVADRLRAAVRASDFVARLGGDEFTVLCENVTDLQEAAAVARRVVEALGRPFVLHGAEVPLAVSIGIAVAAGEPETPDRLLEQADLAMYRAKTEGGGGYRFWDDGEHAEPAGSGAPSIE
jgi:diguanylate cyclase (GGDEF)-like protein/PAS domain S-box-containing protein